MNTTVLRWVVFAIALVVAGDAVAQPSPTPAPTPIVPLNLQGRAIERVQFRGNRKVEDDAIRVQLLSKPGTLLDAAKLREDLRAMWKMGFSLTANVSVTPPLGATSASTSMSAKKPIFHIARRSSRSFAASSNVPGFDSSWTRIASSSTLRLPRNCTRSIARPWRLSGAVGAGAGLGWPMASPAITSAIAITTQRMTAALTKRPRLR